MGTGKVCDPRPTVFLRGLQSRRWLRAWWGEVPVGWEVSPQQGPRTLGAPSWDPQLLASSPPPPPTPRAQSLSAGILTSQPSSMLELTSCRKTEPRGYPSWPWLGHSHAGGSGWERGHREWKSSPLGSPPDRQMSWGRLDAVGTIPSPPPSNQGSSCREDSLEQCTACLWGLDNNLSCHPQPRGL